LKDAYKKGRKRANSKEQNNVYIRMITEESKYKNKKTKLASKRVNES